MNEVHARVPAANGAKYVQQLCTHWAHKLPVDFADDTGVVTFEGAVATMQAGPEAIDVTLRGEDRPDLDRLKDVVARHLERFAFREAPLTFDWRWA